MVLFNVKIGLFFLEFQIKSFGVFDGLVIFSGLRDRSSNIFFGIKRDGIVFGRFSYHAF